VKGSSIFLPSLNHGTPLLADRRNSALQFNALKFDIRVIARGIPECSQAIWTNATLAAVTAVSVFVPDKCHGSHDTE
jgi:hypothetical protein